MIDQVVIRLAANEAEIIEAAAKSWGIAQHMYVRLQATAPRADWPAALGVATRKDPQIRVRLRPGEKEIIEIRAEAENVSRTRYVRLQAVSPTADWRMRRVFVPRVVAQSFPVDELERLPSGWFKIAGDAVWFWIEGVSDGQPAIP